MATRHFITDRKLAFRGDIDFDGFYDAGIDIIAGFNPIHLLVVLHLQIVEFLFIRTDDLINLIANRRRVDLDAIIDRSQFAQEGLGDLAIGRNDDFTGFRINHVERDFLAQQYIA